jgi:hypothetical protein
MKPTKSKIYCFDCGRHKILFESEKKAETFMKFNNEEIETESGYSPNRAYYCISCNGWHVTSGEKRNVKSKTEIVLDLYREEAAEKKKRTESRVSEHLELKKILNSIDELIKSVDDIKNNGSVTESLEILNIACSKIEIAKTIKGETNRKLILESKLDTLRKEIQLLAEIFETIGQRFRS